MNHNKYIIIDEEVNNSTMINADEEPKKTGISIEEAMSILSFRADNGGEKELHSSSSKTFDPQLKQMGQTLDLMASQQWTRIDGGGKGGCNGSSGNDHHVESPLVIQERQEMARMARQDEQNTSYEESNGSSSASSSVHSKLKESLSKQSADELLQTLFKLQRERVAAYQTFNQGLEVVLKSGNFTQYPHLATNITAAFVVVSNSIKEIQRLIDEVHGKNQIKMFIGQLQSYEKDLLHLTAALHLEKMRERNEVLDMSVGSSGNSGNSGNSKITQLLRESISSLQEKAAQRIENINDVLEELRYAAADLNH